MSSNPAATLSPPPKELTVIPASVCLDENQRQAYRGLAWPIGMQRNWSTQSNRRGSLLEHQDKAHGRNLCLYCTLEFSADHPGRETNNA